MEAQQQPMDPYERTREATRDMSTQVHEAWTEGDHLKARQRAEMEDVRRDPTLSEQGVAERLEQIEERYAGRIQAAYATARQALRKRAKDTFRWSLPAPGTEAGIPGSLEGLSVQDANEDLAVQGRVAALRQRIEARKSGPIKPSENPTMTILREEFAKSLEGSRSDAESRLGYLAALRVAEETIGVERALDEFRTERHRRYAAEHQQLTQAAQALPSGVRKQSPFPSKPRRNVAGGPLGQTPGMRRSASGGGAKRRPQWK